MTPPPSGAAPTGGGEAELRRGTAYAFLAYGIWGMFPLYFAALEPSGAWEILAHRILWTLAVVALVLLVRRDLAWIRPFLSRPRLVAGITLAALLIAGNWVVYVLAVLTGRTYEAALGYFLNPIVTVGLGVLVLGERLRRLQWAAVAVGAVAAVYLTVAGGVLPWISLSLAFSFGLYGLMRKTAALGALEGLTLETLLLAPPAIALLAWWTWQGSGGLAHDGTTLAWLIGLGPMTSVPLLLFAAGARRISLATLGVLQYVSPTIQLALGLWVFGESLSGDRLVGFTLTWLALAVFSVEGWLHARRR